MRAPRLLVVFALFALPLMGLTVGKTHPGIPESEPVTAAQQHLTHPEKLPVVVNGDTSPWKVPDSVATRHFVMTSAISRTPTEREIARRNQLLNARLALSREDQAAFASALRDVHEELGRIKHERKQHSQDSAAARSALATLKLQENGVLADAMVRLRQELSPDGARRVDTYIQEYVKRRITIFGAVVH